jgi:predicted PurR-regulated permease PerM
MSPENGSHSMMQPYGSDFDLEQRLSRKLLDVFIRAAIAVALVILCYRIFAPFFGLMAWSVILAVTLYPIHQKLARTMKGKQGLAATVLVVVGLVLIGAPTAVLMGSLGDSLQNVVASIRDGSLKVPAPSPGVADWPLVGPRIHEIWTQAHTDLSALVRSRQPQVTDLARRAFQVVASTAGGVLVFLFSFIVAGVVMAWGAPGARSIRAIFGRLVGAQRGDEFALLCTQTIRAVALGVLGVAFIQAMVIGLLLVVAEVPFAGMLALLVLLMGIVQAPALLLTLPVIAWIWSSGAYAVSMAITYSILLLIGGMLDNVLKPLLLGRGVDAPMPVILLGALGGLATTGILGMFIGAVFLALGYQAFMWWVANSPDSAAAAPGASTQE